MAKTEGADKLIRPLGCRLRQAVACPCPQVLSLDVAQVFELGVVERGVGAVLG